MELDRERDVTIIGVDPRSGSGVGVASGDLNNDATDDLVIGAVFAFTRGSPLEA